jgi:hypothetical protein
VLAHKHRGEEHAPHPDTRWETFRLIDMLGLLDSVIENPFEHGERPDIAVKFHTKNLKSG